MKDGKKENEKVEAFMRIHRQVCLENERKKHKQINQELIKHEERKGWE